MPTFAYQARNKQGERVQGQQEAADKQAALLALREAGLFVTQLNALAAKKAPAAAQEAGGNWWWRAKPKEMSLYFRQMYAMLHAGTSVAAALGTMANSAPNSRLRSASLEMSRNVAKGKTWSAEMRRYPGLFSPLMLAMIHSGEVGGFIDRACSKLADYSEKDHHIQQVISRETWYPKLLIFAAIFILNGPPLVVAILKSQAIAPAVLSYFMGVMFPLSAIFVVWLVSSGAKFIMPLAQHLRILVITVDRIKLFIPVIGKTVRNLAIAKFCRAFAALNAAGLGIAMSLDLAGEACGNMAITSCIKKIIPQVEQGQSITDSLISTQQFQEVTLQMIRIGEVSGKFDEQLNSVAEFMELEGESSIHKSMVVLGGGALLVGAVMVGYYVINFWMNYYNGIFDTMNM